MLNVRSRYGIHKHVKFKLLFALINEKTREIKSFMILLEVITSNSIVIMHEFQQLASTQACAKRIYSDL